MNNNKSNTGDPLVNKGTGSFRDSIATIEKDTGKRHYINPKKPKGNLYKYRTYLSWVLLAVFFITPFLRFRGEPLVLFNLVQRKFIILGTVFWPQDFYLFVIGFITFVVFIIFFTVIFGRIWCGWACPQTIFMEMVFRKIEYWIDGDSGRQAKLKKQPWNAEKIRKRTLKYLIFAFISLLIGHLAWSYLVGSDAVINMVSNGPAAHKGTFIGVMAFSAVFMGVFSWFREQACIVVCPYGRLQGVMLNADSMVVAYDHVRGEPRGKIRKKDVQQENGDCIDCKLCVQVCPTGIDIRNGTQLECVNCTACIDACDEVMTKIKKPPKLIRVASENMIENCSKFHFTPRVIAYSVLLGSLLVLMGILLTVNRGQVEATILRPPGSMFVDMKDGRINNLYTYQVISKSQNPIQLEFKLASPEDGELKHIGEKLPLLEKGGIAEGTLQLILHKSELT